jgi:hypothetical protein
MPVASASSCGQSTRYQRHIDRLGDRLRQRGMQHTHLVAQERAREQRAEGARGLVRILREVRRDQHPQPLGRSIGRVDEQRRSLDRPQHAVGVRSEQHALDRREPAVPEKHEVRCDARRHAAHDLPGPSDVDMRARLDAADPQSLGRAMQPLLPEIAE